MEENIEVKALEYGIADYLTKPYSSKGILHRIRNSLSRIELTSRLNRLEIDQLTQIFNIDAFYRYADNILDHAKPDEKFFAVVTNIKNFNILRL